jgi:hypothetical protein
MWWVDDEEARAFVAAQLAAALMQSLQLLYFLLWSDSCSVRQVPGAHTPLSPHTKFATLAMQLTFMWGFGGGTISSLLLMVRAVCWSVGRFWCGSSAGCHIQAAVRWVVRQREQQE